MERFRVQMHRAAEGNFELEEIGGNDEIASLYHYLGTMIGEIQRLLAQVYQDKLHADRLTIQQKDAEFKMLASQINPHFLYNTLETIRMKARKSGQKDIEEIVQMLARIMAGVREEKVVISIEDDGLGIPLEKLETMRQRLNRYDEKGRHIGVANVHQHAGCV